VCLSFHPRLDFQIVTHCPCFHSPTAFLIGTTEAVLGCFSSG